MAHSWFWGKPGGYQQLSNYLPYQQEAFKQLTSSGLQQLQDPTAGFAPYEQYARKQFQQQTLPSIAERFLSFGGEGGSSAYPQILGQSASDFDAQLNAQRTQFGQQNRQQLLQQIGMGLTPQFENIYQEGSPGLVGHLGQGLMRAIPGAIQGAVTAGPWGALAGGAMGAFGGDVTSTLSQFGRRGGYGGGPMGGGNSISQILQQLGNKPVNPYQAVQILNVLRGM